MIHETTEIRCRTGVDDSLAIEFHHVEIGDVVVVSFLQAPIGFHFVDQFADILIDEIALNKPDPSITLTSLNHPKGYKDNLIPLIITPTPYDIIQ